MDAKPEDWPRYAPAGLVLIALAAAVTALGAAATAADRSTAAGIAAAVAALLGLCAAGLTIAGIRRAVRRDRWTPNAQAGALIASLVVGLALAVTAYLAGSTVRLVAIATMAGVVFGLVIGSLLWRRAVLRAYASGGGR